MDNGQSKPELLNSDRLAERLSDSARILSRATHDFDNVLTGILGFAELTLPLLAAGTTELRFATEIMQVGLRGQEMTRLMRDFTGSGVVAPRPSDLRSVWTAVTGRLAGSPINVVTEFPDSIPSIAIGEQALQTVLKHVVDNACEAMPKGGTITAAAATKKLDAAKAGTILGGCQAGEYVVIKISDTGPGIPEKVRPKIFTEPFFTTKVRHRGLGLAIVYRTLYSHRGGIKIESPPGAGTIAELYLPTGTPRAHSADPSAKTHQENRK